jgi:intein-encoded DNA endonuclease-like protein
MRRKLITKKCNLNNPNFTWILGSLYGDGSIGERRIEISSKDLNFIEQFTERMNRIGFVDIKRHDHHLYRCIYNSKEFVDFIKKIKLEDLYKISNECKKSFVIGFFNAEGCVSCKIYTPHKQSRNLTISNTNLKLIKLTQLFLEDFGITSSISKGLSRPVTHFNNFFKPTKKYIFRLIICGRENFNNFRNFGVLINRKQEIMNELINSYGNYEFRNEKGQFKDGHEYFSGRWK